MRPHKIDGRLKMLIYHSKITQRVIIESCKDENSNPSFTFQENGEKEQNFFPQVTHGIQVPTNNSTT